MLQCCMYEADFYCDGGAPIVMICTKNHVICTELNVLDRDSRSCYWTKIALCFRHVFLWYTVYACTGCSFCFSLADARKKKLRFFPPLFSISFQMVGVSVVSQLYRCTVVNVLSMNLFWHNASIANAHRHCASTISKGNVRVICILFNVRSWNA